MINIEIWSDIVCPFCYIGKRKFEEALEQFPQKDRVEVTFKSYQLDPNTPPYTGQDFYESMGVKFGGVEKSKQMMARIAEQGKDVGIEFNFDTMKPTNTFNAHRLTKFAQQYEKDYEIAEKLFFATFTGSKDIGNITVLAEIAEQVGLNKDKALVILNDESAYAEDVYNDITEAKELGITGVPNFIFNRKYSLSGAQPTEVFLQALEKMVEELQPKPLFEDLNRSVDAGAACGDDGCSTSEK